MRYIYDIVMYIIHRQQSYISYNNLTPTSNPKSNAPDDAIIQAIIVYLFGLLLLPSMMIASSLSFVEPIATLFCLTAFLLLFAIII